MGLLLKNPRMGNTFTLDTGSVVKRTLDGSLIMDSHKRTREQFSMDFVANTVEQRDAFLEFCLAVAGEEIVLTDHEGFEWRGFLVDDAPTGFCAGPGCSYNFSMTFDGEIITEIPQPPEETP
jgi:hypothetical protein